MFFHCGFLLEYPTALYNFTWTYCFLTNNYCRHHDSCLRWYVLLLIAKSSWPGASESTHCKFARQRMNNICICAVVKIWVTDPYFGIVVMTNIGILWQWEYSKVFVFIFLITMAILVVYPLFGLTQMATLGTLIMSSAPGCWGSDRWACAQEQGDFGGSCGSGGEPTWRLNSSWK